MMDIFKNNNREVVFYGTSKDVYGQTQFQFIDSIPRYRANMRTVGYVACVGKQTFDNVYAISNSDELREAWRELCHRSFRGPEGTVVFGDFLDYLVSNDEGRKF